MFKVYAMLRILALEAKSVVTPDTLGVLILTPKADDAIIFPFQLPMLPAQPALRWRVVRNKTAIIDYP